MNKEWSPEELIERQDVLHIDVPLTPSANTTKQWDRGRKWSRIKLHRLEQEKAIMASLVQQKLAVLLKGGFPWSIKAIIYVVRCSDTERFLDEDNVIGGLKTTIDALITSNVIPDDSPDNVMLGGVQQRVPSERQGLRGPATHLFIERIG